MDPAALRAQFPVLARTAYLNTGTCGPLPRAAAAAARDVLDRGLAEGRAGGYFASLLQARTRLRAAYARVLGAAPADVALTSSTSEGIARVLAGLDLRRGDEVLTSDEEHPGLTGPLAAARDQRGITVRVAPFDAIAGAVGPATRLVACSHVSWRSGRMADVRGIGDVPVLLDGAQGAGAVPTDVTRLGCAFYAGSGQKWLCGPIGSGMLWVAPRWRERLPARAPAYLNLADPDAELDAVAHATAARHDAPALAPETMAGALAAVEVLAEAGWAALHGRAAALAAGLAAGLAGLGRELVARGPTTLVAWHEPEPRAALARLAAAGVTVRDLPGGELMRASVGAWNDASDVERLLAALEP